MGVEAESAGTPSRWLCRTELERARFLDMHDRVRTARRVQGLALGSVAIFAASWYGWWLALLALLAGLWLVLLERVFDSDSRPELAAATSMAVLELMLAGGVMGTGGAESPLLAFLTVPPVMLAARFRPTVVVVGVAASLLMTAAAVVGAVLLPPPPAVPRVVDIAAYLGLLASLVAASTALLTAELASRGDAVVDQLTGLFNRKALHGRFEEASTQARLLHAPVSMIICDLDHFKTVNDEYGHDRGDIVLREVAYRMRKTLRVFDLVYRLGGEEFLVLLPGQDESTAVDVAERLVRDVEAGPLAGLAVTMSAGVATGWGDDLDFDTLLKRADVALYAAKDGGRNRVHPAPAHHAFQL